MFPGRANIPGYRWFDRDRYQRRPLSVMRFRNYHGLGSYLMDRDLSKDARTLFEIIQPSSNIFSRHLARHRHAPQRGLLPPRPGGAQVLPHRRLGPHRQRRRALPPARGRAASASSSPSTPPTRSTSTRTTTGRSPTRARASYLDFDRVHRPPRRRAARAPASSRPRCLMMGADHGHTEVNEHFDLEAFIEKRGSRRSTYPKQVKRWLGADAAVMVAGNGMGHIYLKGAGQVDRAPRPPRCTSSAPRRSSTICSPTKPSITSSTGRRAARCTCARAAARPRSRCRRRSRQLPRPRPDPFGYGALPREMTRAEVARAHRRHRLPRRAGPGRAGLRLAARRRLPDLGHAAATICAPREGEASSHRSCHGSLHREHMRVPFAVNHPIADRHAALGRRLPDDPRFCSGRDRPAGLDGVSLA